MMGGMSPYTGAIAHFETETDANEAGYTIPLDEPLAQKMRRVNRATRRELIAEGMFPRPGAGPTPAHALAKRAGMTDEDLRKLRNAAKRARRQR